MNRKGFAVTAVIYGLAILGILIMTILMGTLSSSRNNVSEEAKRIEKELISFNKSSVVYTTGEYYFTVPEGETGWYRIEGYGRSMANARGAFVTGIIYLEEGKTLYVSIPEGDTDSIIKVGSPDGPLILRAAGGYGDYPGGTLKPQCRESLGGDLSLDNFQLKEMTHKNLIGSESVSYNPASCPGAKTSYMAGYPGSGEEEVVGGFPYYFVDGLMLPASHEGIGKVIIQLLSKKDDETPTIPRANEKFNGVKGLRVISSASATLTDVYVTSSGSNVYTYTGGSTTGNINFPLYFNDYCGGVCNVDDISVIFSTTNNPYVNYVELKMIRADDSEVTIYKSDGSNKGLTSTPTGIKLSAFQPDSLRDLPSHGNYYMIPVVSNHKIVSARKDSETDANPIGIEYINGDSRQKWTINEINFYNVKVAGVKEYYLTESSRYKAMAIYKDENLAKNRVSASMTFNTLSRNLPQVWQITSMGDGTYGIKTSVPSYISNRRSGYLTANTAKNVDGSGADYYEQLMIGYVDIPNVASDADTRPTITERFNLYALDFSHTR